MSIGPVGGVGGAGNIRQNQNVGAARPQETSLPTRGDGVDVDLSAAKNAPTQPQQNAAPAPAQAETPKAPAGSSGPSVPTTLFDDGANHVASSHENSGPSYLSLAGSTLPAAASGQLNTVGSAQIGTLSDPTPLNHVPFAKNRNPFEENPAIHTKTAIFDGGGLMTGVGSVNLSYVGGHGQHTFAAVGQNRNPFEEQA